MSAFDQALAALRGERDQLTGRLHLVENAIGVLEGLSGAPVKGKAAPPARRSGAVYACHACGQAGHTARNKACPKRAPAGSSAAKAFGSKAEPVKAELAGPHNRLQAIKAAAQARA